MNKLLLGTTLAVAGLAATTTASAIPVDVFYSTAPGLGIAIPDDDPAGVSATISVPETGTIVGLAIMIQMNHTWVGDLIFRLTGPDGTTIVLADQPGTTDPDLDAGDSSNLSLARPIIFGDLSTWAAENMGAGACTGTDSIIGTDCTRWFLPDTSLAGTFGGMSAFGDWTLNISDNTGLDLGTLDAWLIAFDIKGGAIPLPPAVWLFASGLFALVARRRRR